MAATDEREKSLKHDPPENKYTRWSIYFYNFFFFFFAVAFIYLGVWFIFKMQSVGITEIHFVVLIAVICFIVAVLIMISQILLCSGTFWQNKTTLYVFLGIMWVVLILECFVVTWLFSNLNAYTAEVRLQLTSLMTSYGEDDARTMDNIQYDYGCCGVVNYRDWYNTTWGHKHPHKLPGSCCGSFARICGANMTAYGQGCAEPVSTLTYAVFAILLTFTLFAAFYQVVGISLSYVLTRVIHDLY